MRYADVGMKGFAFFRKNPWIFMAAPTVLQMAFSILGLRKTKPTKPIPGAVAPIPNPAEGAKSPSLSGPDAPCRAYQLYRRIRPFFL